MPKTPSYLVIQKQIQDLQRQAESLRGKEVKGVIASIKEAIAAYGITAADLGFGVGAGTNSAKAPKVKRGRKIGGNGSSSKSAGAAKYSDGNGNEWGGRGPRPRWLREALAAGRSLEEFDHRVGNG